MRNFWCEVNLKKLEDNINKIKSRTDKKIMAVVKGNCYGLGLERIVEFLEDKVDCFATAYIEEAMKINTNKDILVLTPNLEYENIKNIKENVILSVDDYEDLFNIAKLNRLVRVHIYVNTGMNRFGIKPDDLNKFIDDIRKSGMSIEIDGIYTHLHNTGNKKYTLNQIKLFEEAVLKYRMEIPNIHVLNSGGFLKFNEACDFDNMIRVGAILFGYQGLNKGFKKIYQYKAIPISSYLVEKGQYIGYDNRYKAKKNMIVGVLDFGYSDKFYYADTIWDNKVFNLLGRVYFKNRYQNSITYKGKKVKIIGSTNMNYNLIDMEDIPEDAVLDVDISSIAADNSIDKKYIFSR